MEDTATRPPWLVRMHYRMRTASFAMLFVATSLHLVGKDYGPGAWVLLGLLLLVYPHLQYWRARRAGEPVKAEMFNLLVDSVLLGMYAAALGFSLWLTFSATLGTLINNAANKGWRGVGENLLAFFGGATVWIAIGGLQVSLNTEWTATLFCIVGLTGYLLTMGSIGFRRNLQLRTAREDLRLREQELLAVNQALLNNLQEIDTLRQQLHEQVIRDPLTNLYNRRYLDSTLGRELARCKREGQSLSLIMIDIDHFKKINDTYGHQAGDEVLRRLGNLLGSAAREGDVACRYGGEEFLLLMPTMSLGAARERAEELCATFRDGVVPFGDFRLRATLSIGIAAYPGHGTSPEALIGCADSALYQAKEGGRDQVQVAPLLPRVEDGEALAANFVKLVWQSAYESGHPIVDDQHRALFADVNKLLGALLSKRTADEVSALIDKLVDDVVEHSRDEEAIIASTGYPGAAEHAATHSELVGRARRLVGLFHAGELDGGDLFLFLTNDLVARHILGADREYFPFLDPRRTIRPDNHRELTSGPAVPLSDKKARHGQSENDL